MADRHHLISQHDSTKAKSEKLPRSFVVIAGNVGDVRAFTRLAEHFLHNVIVPLMPVPAALQGPAVDNVADQIQILRFCVLQEFKQQVGLAANRAQVNIGNPDSAVAEFARFCLRIVR